MRRGWLAGSPAKTLAFGFGSALLFFALFAQSRAVAAAPMRLLYSVHHAIFGNIGTYSNTIEKKDGATLVFTHAHFRVRILGIPLGGEEGRHVEEWAKNRLIYFHGITYKGSKRFVVLGKAVGNKFVIHSSLGTITAPASVHPANPWSANILDSRTMMRVDTGKLEKVRVEPGKPVSAKIEGETVPCRKYELIGNTKYWVWLDAQGVPVEFKVDDNTGMVTFTLSHCTGCSLDDRYASRR